MKPRFAIYSLWIASVMMLGACSASPTVPVLSKISGDDKKKDDAPAPAPAPAADATASKAPETTAPPATRDLQNEALAILNKACVGCHSAANVQGGFGNVDNVESMLASGRYLVAGSPEKSLIFTKLAPTGNMPPSGAIKPEEVATIKTWISGLTSVQVVPLRDGQILDAIQKDLQLSVPVADQVQIRYFSFQVPNNIGTNAAGMDTMRLAFAKVINSLSRSPVLIKPVAVDSKKLIYRIRLDEMGIPATIFDSVMADFYPFQQKFVNNASDPASILAAQNDQTLRQATGTANYLMRGDWFMATATLPILYERLLQLGTTQAQLDQQLGINIVQNINANRVIRAGFKNSGVSSQNRMMERHSQSNGLAYWISYDFAKLIDIENIFANPLGPQTLNNTKEFAHDGGEIIFQLPNGMLGYRLVNNAGVILDKGPTSIVKQAEAPSSFLSAIVNGMSCMSCHGAGLLYKKDEIRAFAQANVGNFSQAELQQILNLYPEETIFKAQMDKDNAFHFNALQQMGIDPKKPDPVNQAFRFYNRSLSKIDVAEELGITASNLDSLLQNEPYRTAWSSLRSAGFISRNDLSLLQAQAIEQARIDVDLTAPRQGDFLPTPACMSADFLQMDACLVVAAVPGQ